MEDKLKELESDLKKEMEDITVTLAVIEKSLKELNESVRRMNTGLYGDEVNDHIGVIERQKTLEDRLRNLEGRLDSMDKNRIEQLAAKTAEKEQRVNWMYWGKIIFRIVVEMIIIYMVIKGTMTIDKLK